MNEQQMRFQLLQTAFNIKQAQQRVPDAAPFTDEDVIATAEKLSAWLNATTTPAA